MKFFKKNQKRFTVVATTLMLVSSSFALDTTEPFDKGVSDIESYLSASGVKSNSDATSLGYEMVIGAGITDKFGALVSFDAGSGKAQESDNVFMNGWSEFGLGLLLNAVDQEVFKLDFMTNYSSAGEINIATELNFDFTPKFGLQLSADETFSDGGTDILYTTGLAPMLYWTLNENNQILFATDFSIPSVGDAEVGSATLGYNVVLNDNIELITEVGIDIPQDDEEASASFSIGFVGTL